MMLLRTLVLERDGQDAPVNGALLCGFAVGQTASNFLVYSLDEEVEPGSSRVYIAALRKKQDRYFLSGVESKEDLQVALHVFKQILTLAASGVKAGGVTETQVPYHFVELKGCKLPPARPEDHHSVIIKKALVMKVITLGMSAATLPAIESASLIVPSIRFSSQMTSPPKVANPTEPPRLPIHEQPVEAPLQATVEAPIMMTQAAPSIQREPVAPAQPTRAASGNDNALFEVDSTLTNLARVSQELTQQKRVVIEREAALEQWQARLQQAQNELDEKARELEHRTTQLHDQSLAVSQRTEALKVMAAQVSGLRQSLRGMLLELDGVLDS
jgi:hypothetical protein